MGIIFSIWMKLKIVDDTLSRLSSTSVDKYKTSTRKAQFHANEVLETSWAENN